MKLDWLEMERLRRGWESEDHLLSSVRLAVRELEASNYPSALFVLLKAIRTEEESGPAFVEEVRRTEVGCQARREDPTGSGNPRETEDMVASARAFKSGEILLMLFVFCALLTGVLLVLRGLEII